MDDIENALLTTPTPPTSLKGVEVIKHYLQDMPALPGVYRMLNEKGDVLYVGKAKNLPKRVVNYTQLARLTPRIAAMVLATTQMEITTTRTEAESLLLESNLIKSLKPRYNILLRDDKSFPYIELTMGHDYPAIKKHRGRKKNNSLYFGPYASAGDVNRSLATLQKTFLLRTCTDSEFAKRTRPCMEYQIKRCSAPCVDKISHADYLSSSKHAKEVLSGKSHEVKLHLQHAMEQASETMEFEKAAIYRDKIKALSAIQATQDINSHVVKNADVIAITEQQQHFCVQLFFIRHGQTLGTKAFFPRQTDESSLEEVLEAFLSAFYQDTPCPPLLLISHDIHARQVLEEALSSINEHRVKIDIPLRGEKRKFIEITLENAKNALTKKRIQEASEKEILQRVAEIFHIDHPIKRIDVFDNSHIFGKHAVGGMIVAGEEGFIKQAYRTFNVDAGEKVTGGDDYFMMRQMLSRRYRPPLAEDAIPDLILIDGGAAHLAVATEVFSSLDIPAIPYACIAKGPDRNAGREDFHLPNQTPFTLAPNDPALYYLQRIRDEAHRFAITTHRNKRQKNTHKSALDDIEGVGPHRKKMLLLHFGSVHHIKEATLEELCNVPNINKKTAQLIHEHFHP